MTIKTWTSFSKRRNSTKQPTGSGNNKTIVLKHPTSIINPVFLLTDYNLADNYCQWGNRYYFIDDIILINAGQAEYHCSVDPMASWKTGIGTSTEFVTRAASDYDEALPDMLYPSKVGFTQDGVRFETLHNSTASFRASGGGGYYVVGIYGGGGGTGAISYYILTSSEFSTLITYLFNVAILDATETDFTLATQKMLINPAQYIASCFWYPFDTLSGVGSGDVLSFGWWQTNLGVKVLDPSDRKFIMSDSVTLPNHPDAATRGKYCNDAPFTRRSLYCWSFGQIPIDAAACADNNTGINLVINVDLFTGAAILEVAANLKYIGKYSGQIGVPIQLAQLTQDVQRGVLSPLAAIGSALSLNFLGAASAIGDSLNSWAPQVSSVGSTGSAGDYLMSPRIESEFKSQSAMDAAQNGRPLCAPKVINTLSGYVKCENADVDLPCTQEERDKIAAYLNGGFFYE